MLRVIHAAGWFSGYSEGMETDKVVRNRRLEAGQQLSS